IATKVENNVYEKDMSIYYKKLTNKDMSFYRDSHAGHLTAMFRQFLDSAILFNRLVRSDIVRTFVSLVFPAIVLLIASWQIGVIAIALTISQAIYMFWSSAKANQYREESHEIYRRISGEVADDVTNIIA